MSTEGRRVLLPNGRRAVGSGGEQVVYNSLGECDPCCDPEECAVYYEARPCSDFAARTVAIDANTCGGRTLWFWCRTPLLPTVALPGGGTATTLEELAAGLPNTADITISYEGNCYRIREATSGGDPGGAVVGFRWCPPGDGGDDCIDVQFGDRLRAPKSVARVPSCAESTCEPFGEVVVPFACGIGPDARVAICLKDLSDCFILPYSTFWPDQPDPDNNCAVFDPATAQNPREVAGLDKLDADNFPYENPHRTCCECVSAEVTDPVCNTEAMSRAEFNEGLGAWQAVFDQGECCCPSNYTVTITETYRRAQVCPDNDAAFQDLVECDNQWTITYVGGVPVVPIPDGECYFESGVSAGPSGVICPALTGTFPVNGPTATCTGYTIGSGVRGITLGQSGPSGPNSIIVFCPNPGDIDVVQSGQSYTHACGVLRASWTRRINCPSGAVPVQEVTEEYSIEVVVSDADIPAQCADGCSEPIVASAVARDRAMALATLALRDVMTARELARVGLRRSKGCGGCGKHKGL